MVRRHSPRNTAKWKRWASALRVLREVRKRHGLSKQKEAEAIGLIERFLFMRERQLQREARMTLVAFGESGAPAWRRLLRHYKSGSGYSYDANLALRDMRLLGKAGLPLLSDFLKILWAQNNSSYWQVLPVIQAIGADACAPLLAEVLESGTKDAVGRQRRQMFLYTLARMSPICSREWETLLRSPQELQRDALRALSRSNNLTLDGLLRLVAEHIVSINPKNGMVYDNAFSRLLYRFQSISGHAMRLCQNPSARKKLGDTIHLWKRDSLLKLLRAFRKHLDEPKNPMYHLNNGFLIRMYRSPQTVRHLQTLRVNATRVWSITRGLSNCFPEEKKKLFAWAFVKYAKIPSMLKHSLFSFLQADLKNNLEKVKEWYQKGQKAERKLAFRLLASAPHVFGFSVSELLECVSSEDSNTQIYALQGLGTYQSKAKLALPLLFSLAEKSWGQHLSTKERRLAHQALYAIGRIGLASKYAVNRCFSYWQQEEKCVLGCRPDPVRQQMGSYCFNAFSQTAKPWAVLSTEEWLGMLRRIPKKRRVLWSYMRGFLGKWPERERFWGELFKMAQDEQERAQLLRQYVGIQDPETLDVLWLGLRSSSETLQRIVLDRLLTLKSKDPALEKWLLKKTTEKGSTQATQDRLWAALSWIGRDDEKVLRLLLKELWKAPADRVVMFLRALFGREDQHCVLAQELLEYSPPTTQARSLVLSLLSTQKRCFRYALPTLWKEYTVPRGHQTEAGAHLRNIAALYPREIMEFFVNASSKKKDAVAQLILFSPVRNREAFRAWFELLSDTRPVVRDFAERYIRNLGNRRYRYYDPSFCDVLLEQWKAPQKRRRVLAMYFFLQGMHSSVVVRWLRQDPKRQKGLGPFIKVLQESPKGLHYQGIWYVSSHQTFFQESLLSSLKHAKESVRLFAISALRRMPYRPIRPLIPTLLHLLEEGSPQQRLGILAFLWLCKWSDKEIQKILVVLLKEQTRPVRFLAARLLGYSGRKEAIPVLFEIMRVGSAQQRREVASWLKKLAHHAALLRPLFREVLTKEKDPSTQTAMFYALAEIPGLHSSMQGILKEKLSEAKRHPRYLWPLARVLSKMKEPALWSAPMLWDELLKRPHQSYGSSSLVQALGGIGEPVLDRTFAMLREW
ncbi:MAG: HEAT repeat domain-containing protein [Myxococcales bacterium]|nr:HEAT repeat domain-containing protein [Myxococcales bacterium]